MGSGRRVVGRGRVTGQCQWALGGGRGAALESPGTSLALILRLHPGESGVNWPGHGDLKKKKTQMILICRQIEMLFWTQLTGRIRTTWDVVQMLMPHSRPVESSL